MLPKKKEEISHLNITSRLVEREQAIGHNQCLSSLDGVGVEIDTKSLVLAMCQYWKKVDDRLTKNGFPTHGNPPLKFIDGLSKTISNDPRILRLVKVINSEI